MPPRPRPPLNLNYAAPSASNSAALATALVTQGIIVAVDAAIVLVVFLVVIPRFQETFQDFKIDLPGFTKAVLFLARLMGRYYLGLVFLPVPVVVPLLTWAALSGRADVRPGRIVTWTLRLSTLFMFLLVVALLVAILVPMMSMMSAVSGGSKH